MKYITRVIIVLIGVSTLLLTTGCTSNKDKLKGLWRGTQATISEESYTVLDKYSIYYFYDDNKLNLGNYDYSTDDYENNYEWVEKGVEYEWVEKDQIDIKIEGSNIFKVTIKGSKLMLISDDYTIEFEKGSL